MDNLKEEKSFNVLAELDAFEFYVSARRYEDAFQQLHKLLNATSVHRHKNERMFAGLKREERGYVACRFVSAVFQLFMDKGFNLTESGYEALSTYARNFTIILSMTPFRNADHVIRHLVGQAAYGDGKDEISLYEFRKFIFLWSIYSDVKLPFERFSKSQPNIVKYLMFNSLTFNAYVDDFVCSRRDMLIELMAQEDFVLELDDKTLTYATPVWMYLTYSDSQRRHVAKHAINNAFRNWMFSHGIKEPTLPVVRSIKEKPTLVVVVEQMNINHAVFRCFGQALESLRERFHTIGIAYEVAVDKQSMSVFDEVRYFEPDIVKGMKKNVGKILKYQPDMIFYLSLGMSNGTVPLANLRLAPIQFMVPAHPATSRIETIDYMITDECSAPDERRDDLSEKLVLVPSGAFLYTDRSSFSHEDIDEKISDLEEGRHKKLRVAVPAFAIKVGAQFIKMLKRVKEQSKSGIEFHFFPHLIENSFIHFKEEVEKVLPDSVFHLPYGYREYLTRVGQCDLYMSTFPFSNFNGTIDSIKVGLPVVAYDSGGLESKGEIGLLGMLGFPDWAIAKTEDEYCHLIVELANNEPRRLELVDFVKQIDLKAHYDACLHLKHTVVDTIYGLYLNHEIIQQSGKHRLLTADVIENVNVSDQGETVRAAGEAY